VQEWGEADVNMWRKRTASLVASRANKSRTDLALKAWLTIYDRGVIRVSRMTFREFPREEKKNYNLII